MKIPSHLFIKILREKSDFSPGEFYEKMTKYFQRILPEKSDFSPGEFSKTSDFLENFKDLYGSDEKEVVCGCIFFSTLYDLI